MIFERKYKIKDGRLVKRANEVSIPADEPLFIFRAQDRKALAALVAYSMIVDDLNHKAEVTKSINDFREFQANNSARMKEPTS